MTPPEPVQAFVLNKSQANYSVMQMYSKSIIVVCRKIFGLALYGMPANSNRRGQKTKVFMCIYYIFKNP